MTDPRDPEPSAADAAEPTDPSSSTEPPTTVPTEPPAPTARPESEVSGSPRRSRLRIALWAALAAVLVVVAVVGGSWAWVRGTASGHTFTVADAPSADVGLVLGAGLRPDGSPSEYLRYRLDDAAALYAAGKVKVLLVSGDNRVAGYDEPTSMRDYLVASGVPADRVVRDFAGQDTYDSCVRATQIFGVERALVITQEFHLPRAVFLCRQVGLDADGVADPHRIVTNSPVLREIPASVKAAWDAVWQPDPRHLGPREDGVTAALAAAGS